MTSVSLPVNSKSWLSTLGRWAAELRKLQFVTTKEEVIQYVVNGGPIGAPIFWLVETLPPKHIKIENQLLYVNDYKKLFAVYGYTFGSSATGDQFRLPPMVGRYPFGVDSAGTGSTLGGTFGLKDGAGLKSKKHYHGMGAGADLKVDINHDHPACNTTDTTATNKESGAGVYATTPGAGVSPGVAVSGGSGTVNWWAPNHNHTQNPHKHSVDIPALGATNKTPTGKIGLVTGGVDGNIDEALTGTAAEMNPPSIAGYWITRYDD